MDIEKNIEERLWVYRIKTTGDTESFTNLYNRYVEALYRFVVFKIGNREEAEDVVGELFLKLWEYLRNTEEEITHVKYLVYRMARNGVIDVYRERAKKRTTNLDDAAHIVDHRLDIVTQLAQKDDMQELMQAIKTLKQEYQEIIFLRYVEGLSFRDIAKILHKSGASVRVTAHRAMRKLEQMNPKYGS